jgi:hypothetical protein
MIPDARYQCATGATQDNHGICITWMTYHRDTNDNTDVPSTFKRNPTKENFMKYRGKWPSDAQIINMGKLVAIYIKRYPDIQISGHHQYTSKGCPVFWTPSWVAAGGIPGLDQAGIDKLIRARPGHRYEAGTGTEAPGYANYSGCDGNYGPKGGVYTKAGEYLAEISNPGGVGTGAIPAPPQCFLSGTKITMDDGKEKNIEDIIIGDSVKSFNTDINEVIDSIVTEIFTHSDTKEYYIINNNLKVTGEHPIWINNEWKEVNTLKIEDELLKLDGSKTSIKSIEIIKDNVTVYNFEVDNTHNYFANSYLVHNKLPQLPIENSDVDDFGNPVRGSDGFKDFRDMNCSEFKTFYYNIRNNGPLNGPKNLQAFESSLPDSEARADFSQKTYECQDTF